MSASVENGLEAAWSIDRPRSAKWDELPTDGTHAWLGLLLLLGSSVVAVRGACWLIAQSIRLFH